MQVNHINMGLVTLIGWRNEDPFGSARTMFYIKTPNGNTYWCDQYEFKEAITVKVTIDQPTAA